MNKYFRNFLGRTTHIPPESSGKDGYTVFMGYSEIYISGKEIDEVEQLALKMRTSFYNNGDLYALPIQMTEQIRQEEFNRQMLTLIQEKS